MTVLEVLPQAETTETSRPDFPQILREMKENYAKLSRIIGGISKGKQVIKAWQKREPDYTLIIARLEHQLGTEPAMVSAELEAPVTECRAQLRALLSAAEQSDQMNSIIASLRTAFENLAPAPLLEGPKKHRRTPVKKTENEALTNGNGMSAELSPRLQKKANAPLFVDAAPLTPEQAAIVAPTIIQDLAQSPGVNVIELQEIRHAMQDATQALREATLTPEIPVAEMAPPEETLTAPIATEILEEALRVREEVDPGILVGELKKAFQFVSRQVIGREQLLTQALYAMLTREHQLIYSRAGTAKSLFASSVFGLFRNAPTFSIQMTKGTPEEALVGGIDFAELKRGNLTHKVDGSIVTSRFAFLDEIFDANDVALRSLLGILNERIFRKGKQQVPAILHNAIATSNYIRATEITEAVIDRFPFRSYLTASDSPYDQLLIDDAYARNAGRVVLPEGQKVPFENLSYLADIVEGQVPGKEITAPWHVLFIKNAVIAKYMEELNKKRKSSGKPDAYVSPRTIAKTRDILNASALLRGRTELALEDLEDMKYMVCTIGDSDGQEEIFDQAKADVTRGLRPADRKAVDILMEGHDLLTAVLDNKGKAFPMSFLEQVKCFFRISSPSELTLAKVRETVQQIAPEHPLVKRLHADLIHRIDNEIRRTAGDDRNPLFS